MAATGPKARHQHAALWFAAEQHHGAPRLTLPQDRDIAEMAARGRVRRRIGSVDEVTGARRFVVAADVPDRHALQAVERGGAAAGQFGGERRIAGGAQLLAAGPDKTAA